MNPFLFSSAVVVGLPYTVGGTDVEIIEVLALTSGGQKVKTAQGLCDSSNVTAKTRFNLDGAGITYKDSSNNTSSYFRSNGAWAKW